ncbi:hypothetical protein [Mucilaginibacter boryungensis]|uniref:Uncharacterized protein n=1 Tax=Mucilaginibacter boryungensis TaxID=768480 RepID=A0ABR9XG39_9SPHI|nr:hypothetical protein [Mucilaginibacter boryungensis]MBE9666363.1 hypothetical protein [Mucilaginibacter boryungensis]
MSVTTYKIQDNFMVANCIKCGRRPVVAQDAYTWIVLCPNAACNNSVEGKTANFKAWDEQNKK